MATSISTEQLTSDLAAVIAGQLREHRGALKQQWQEARPFSYCYLDDLLPKETALRLHEALPPADQLMLRHTDKERKRVGIAIEQYAPEMSAILYAFHQPDVVAEVEAITGLANLRADESLYGSGISEMLEGDYLLPHLDNSHDGDGRLYRVINLLYYITPEWPEDAGGNLELWDKGVKHATTVHARFNRLVLMVTHTDTLHSVSKVEKPGGRRSCISNYYFSATPANQREHIHRTTFFARPEESMARKLKLGIEGKAKNLLARFVRNNMSSTKHRR